MDKPEHDVRSQRARHRDGDRSRQGLPAHWQQPGRDHAESQDWLRRDFRCQQFRIRRANIAKDALAGDGVVLKRGKKKFNRV